MEIAAFSLLFGLLGAAMGEGEGGLAGLLFGAFFGKLLRDRRRLKTLEREQRLLRGELDHLRLDLDALRATLVQPPGAPAPSAAPEPAPPLVAPPHAEPPIEHAPAAPSPISEEGAAQPRAPIPSAVAAPEAVTPATPEAPPASARAELEPQAPSPLDGLEARVRELLLGGNTIVRAGILVLLVGMILLLRWAAEHAVFPLELRMAAAALIAIALVAIGYRQREHRPGFGRTLQGGGIAGLYLVVFFSYRSYELLPGGLAFALLAGIALGSGVLAVLQDAMALVVIGQIGGFMAPVLASSGGGSHVALFSYYLLLNALIFAVAWFKPWRALNLLGFAFTFGIGSSWGALRYRPEDFASTEPFLLAFGALYTLIPVLYALRAPDTRRGWVDASLLFGTPLAVLLLQYAMVKDVPFAMAYSALGLSAFYVGVGALLYKRAAAALRSLVETFLAIGVGFATLAVPYGFDNHDFTGATWALEGAGLYWVGTRQQRWLSRLSGCLLQLAAAAALIVQLSDGSPGAAAMPLANARFLASLLLGLSSLFVAFWAHARRGALPAPEAQAVQLLIALGLFFFVGASMDEIDRQVPAYWQPGVRLSVLAATGLALEHTARRLDWLPGRIPGALLAVCLPLVPLGWAISLSVHPLGRGGALGFALCLWLSLTLLRQLAPAFALSKHALHCAFVWFSSGLGALEAFYLARDFARLNDTWSAGALALVVGLGLIACASGPRRGWWPFREAPETHVLFAGGLLAAALLAWSVWVNANLSGDASPLPSWPLLNPLDLAQLFVFGAGALWVAALAEQALDPGLRRSVSSLLGVLGFYWFNALLARSVHHFAGVPFGFEALWESSPLQVSVSVAWSLLGLLGTVVGSKRALRWLWLLSAGLLGTVVAKLFLIDLDQLGTIAKIGTFLAVGVLLVLVGYLAPVPPVRAQATQGEAA